MIFPTLILRAIILWGGILWAAILCATALSAQPTPAPKPDPSFPFSTEIEDFARADEAGPAVRDAVLFLGSSSIRLWNIRSGFPGRPTVNRGFGGATTPDILHYYPRLRPRATPHAVVVYAGENDLAAGAKPDAIARNILTLIGKLRADYPRARIALLSLKPSPIRWTLWPGMTAINRIVSGRARAAGFAYLDVGSVLLAGDGLPDASLFRSDGLHMNDRGYALWNRLVGAWLETEPLRAQPTARRP
ncbi:GDSL-type esterase/lipase family protein [Sphingobium sufflavum]|nr:GDSL-type esterase/lipase family protein [Sphingobium sufflavum]